jgi:hypothetical protein
MSQISIAVLKVPAFQVATVVMTPLSDDDASFYAWRCTWQEVEGKVMKDAGATYSHSRLILSMAIEVMNNTVDLVNPMIYLRPKSFTYVKISKEMFMNLLSLPKGLIHHPEGFHPEDFEPG